MNGDTPAPARTGISDEDITAFRAPPPATPPPLPRRRRLWPWLLGAFVVLALSCAVIAAALVAGLGDLVGNEVSVSVDGETWRLGALHGAAVWTVALALTAVIGVVLVVVPLLVLFGLLAAALGIAAALLAALLAAAAACSPLILLGLLVWWIVRRRPARPAAAAG